MFRGGNSQVGNGLGGVLRGLLRSVAPLLKVGGKQLLNEGVGLMQDVMQGKNLKRAVTRRAIQTGKKLLKRTLQNQIFSPPGEPNTKRPRKTRKTRRRRDIFD